MTEQEATDRHEELCGSIQGEAHCNECGVAFFDGEQAYCMEEEDGSLIWFCDEHVPDLEEVYRAWSRKHCAAYFLSFAIWQVVIWLT